MSIPYHFSRSRIAVVVRGAVDSVDVRDHEPPFRDLEEGDPAFEIPFYGFGRCGLGEYIAACERADAVDFSAEAGGVVSVAGEAKMSVVEVAAAVDFILVVGIRGRVDGAAEGGLDF